MKRKPKSRAEAMAIQQKRANGGGEDLLQYRCVMRYNELFSDNRLWAVVNENVPNSTSKGVVRGVSDLNWCPDGRLIGIELKHPDKYHDTKHLVEQAEWLRDVPDKGWFCNSLEMFERILNGGEGISPTDVINRCRGRRSLRFDW